MVDVEGDFLLRLFFAVCAPVKPPVCVPVKPPVCATLFVLVLSAVVFLPDRLFELSNEESLALFDMPPPPLPPYVPPLPPYVPRLDVKDP